MAFTRAGLDYRNYVILNPSLSRPAEVNLLLGDAAKARVELGGPLSTSSKQLIDLVVLAECEALGALHGSLNRWCQAMSFASRTIVYFFR